MHELAHEFTHRRVSPWGGIKFFQQTYARMGVKADLLGVNLPLGGSNRAYDRVDMIEGFLVSVVLGSKRLAHSGWLRMDEIIREIFGWQRPMASASTYSRFFQRFDIDRNDAVFPVLMKKWWDKISLKKMTIDIDSTVITRYGRQEYAKKGYNPHKPNRTSHHPLMAFCDELKMVVNAWMRSGDSHSSTDMDRFLEELLQIIEPGRIGLLRGDRGFYGDRIMGQLERTGDGLPYIIRARMTTRLQEAIMDQEDWYANNDVVRGAQYTSFQYQATKWSNSRCIVVVRVPASHETKRRQGSLFPGMDNYEYSAYVTNTDFSEVMVHSQYNQRADCENRIKELKYDYGVDGFALHSFGAMEAAFRFIMIAYNLMAMFKQKVMTSKIKHRLSTIRFQCIAIGSYLVKDGRNKKLKLSAEGKRRHFLEHFFDNLDLIKPPIRFSNA